MKMNKKWKVAVLNSIAVLLGLTLWQNCSQNEFQIQTSENGSLVATVALSEDSAVLAGDKTLRTTTPKPACASTVKDSVYQSSSGKIAYIGVGNCRLDFTENDYLKPIIITGGNASGLEIDCNGATIAMKTGEIYDGTTVLAIAPGYKTGFSAAALEAEMLKYYDRTKFGTPRNLSEIVSRPENIKIKGCNIHGRISVNSFGGNINLISSRSQMDVGTEHTLRLRAMAPTNITFENLNVTSLWDETNPNFQTKDLFHLFMGVTNVSILNSRFSGKISAVGMYLSPESSGNLIQGNHFELSPGNSPHKREIIALDGSSFNKILNNTFKGASDGGITLFRNCGEQGMTRHATPSFNEIAHNDFFYLKNQSEAIWLNKKYIFPGGLGDDSPLELKTYCRLDEENKEILLDPSTPINKNFYLKDGRKAVLLARSKKLLGSAANTTVQELKISLGFFSIYSQKLDVNHDNGANNNFHHNYFLNYGEYDRLTAGTPVPPIFRRLDKIIDAIKVVKDGFNNPNHKDAAIKFSDTAFTSNITKDNAILVFNTSLCTKTPPPHIYLGVSRTVTYSDADHLCYILPLNRAPFAGKRDL